MSEQIVIDAVLATKLQEAEAKIAGLEAQILEAARKIGESTRLLDRVAQGLYTAKAENARLQHEAEYLRSELESANSRADDWQKVADGRSLEIIRLRAMMHHEADGVTPE